MALPGLTPMVEEQAQALPGLTPMQAQPSTQQQGSSIPGLTPVQQNPQASDSFWGAMGYNLGIGLTDTVRGGAQILNVKEDEMRGQQDKLDANLEQYGSAAYAAWIGGMILDPVGWALPLSRLKHLGLLRHAGKIKKLGMGGKLLNTAGAAAVGGGVAGALGYVDEEADSLIGDGKMTRGEQALMGIGGGAVLGGLGTAGAAALSRSGAGDAAWKAISKPEVAMAITGGTLGGFAGYNSGILEQTEPLAGDLFSEEFVNSGAYAKWRNALLGAAVGAGTGRHFGKTKPHWFVPDSGLLDDVVHSKAKVKPRAKKIQADYGIDKTAKKIDDTIKSLPKASQKTASEFMYKMVTEGPKVAAKMSEGLSGVVKYDDLAKGILKDSPELMRAMTGIKDEVLDTVSKMGKELVDEGLLDEKIWAKNKDKYLHRLYNKPGEAQKVMATGGYELIGDELAPRGLVKAVDEAEWAKMQQNADEMGLGWERWENPEASLRKKGQFNVRRDWTPEERLNMGEHMDLLDAFNATGKILSNDISAAKYMDDLAQAPGVSSSMKASGEVNPVRFGPDMPEELRTRNTRASASSTPPDLGPQKFDHNMKVPDEKRYGNLRGRYVSEDTMRDLKSLNGIDGMSKVMNSNVVKAYQKANSFWKATKTVMNPAVHFNNFMSNIMMYDFGVTNLGMSKWKVLAGAARDLTGDVGKMSDDAVAAMERGVFDTNLTAELAEGDMGPLARSIADKFKGTGDMAQSQTEAAIKHTSSALKFTKKWTYDKMAKAYEFEDNVFRLALFKAEKQKLVGQGMIESMANDRAASKAREWFVDYSRTTPALTALKTLPLPFFSYTYGIIPRLAETAVKHPVKIAKWASIGYLLNEAGAYGSKDTLENIKEEERLMGETNKMYSMVGMRNKIRLPDALNPFDDESAYLDITRAIPGGMPFAANRGGVGQVPFLPESMQPGFGALGGVGFPALGIDQFRGKEIPEGERLGALVRNFTPNLPIPGSGSYAGNKIDLANAGQGSRYKDEHTPGTAWSAGFGAKVTPNDSNKNRQRIKFTYNAKISVVDGQIKRLKSKYREGMISDDKYEKQMETLRNKKQRIKRNRNKAMNG